MVNFVKCVVTYFIFILELDTILSSVFHLGQGNQLTFLIFQIV